MESEILIVAGIGLFLLVAWTLTGWAIVRTGFLRDRDRTGLEGRSRGAADAGGDVADPAHPGPVDPERDPDAIWRGQMKAAAAASGARCLCPPASAPGGAPRGSAAHSDDVVPDPDCPIHRWDFA